MPGPPFYRRAALKLGKGHRLEFGMRAAPRIYPRFLRQTQAAANLSGLNEAAACGTNSKSGGNNFLTKNS